MKGFSKGEIFTAALGPISYWRDRKYCLVYSAFLVPYSLHGQRLTSLRIPALRALEASLRPTGDQVRPGRMC